MRLFQHREQFCLLQRQFLAQIRDLQMRKNLTTGKAAYVHCVS